MTTTASSTQRLTDLEHAYSAHNYHPLDVVLERAEGIWVWDVDGKKYMDFLAAYGAVNQGHNHPKIVQALTEQAGRLSLTSRAFRNNRFGPFCEKLAGLLGYDKVLMMNAGAEAVETAIKAMRRWGYRTKGVAEDKAEIIVFDGNFHGRTTTIVSFSTDEVARGGYGPYTPGFKLVPYGDAEALEEAMNENTVGLLIEPIQGEGGVIIPEPGFLQEVRGLCDENNVMMVCDEIQSGLARTGRMLAQEHEHVKADGVTIGKALSGGLYPVSAFVATDELMSVFDPGSHGSTFGGNPLACAVADAAIDVLLEEDLCDRSQVLGEHMADELLGIGSDKIKEIRSIGLWAGIELHEDAGGARKYSEALQADGLLVKETHVHTLRLAPPLVITEHEIDDAIAKIKKALDT